MATTSKPRHTEVRLPVGDVWLDGILAYTPAAPALVLLTERTASTLATGRGAFIAGALQEAGFATLQIALLSHEEERHAADHWNQVSLLATRLGACVVWTAQQPGLQSLPCGVLAREAAAGAAIRVAVRKGARIVALACRGGRPDMAGLEALRSLATPLLMLVGEDDEETLPPNRQVEHMLAGTKQLVVIPGASHNFEEPGKLDEATRHIVAWFQRWLIESEPQ
jgi:putative phosphoribosyl transferase